MVLMGSSAGRLVNRADQPPRQRDLIRGARSR